MWPALGKVMLFRKDMGWIGNSARTWESEDILDCVVLGMSYGNGVTGSWAGFVCMFVASTLGYDFALES